MFSVLSGEMVGAVGDDEEESCQGRDDRRDENEEKYGDLGRAVTLFLPSFNIIDQAYSGRMLGSIYIEEALSSNFKEGNQFTIPQNRQTAFDHSISLSYPDVPKIIEEIQSVSGLVQIWCRRSQLR